MEKTTSDIINFLDHEFTTWFMSSNEELKSEFDFQPQDFIKFAEYDLTTEYDHNIVNALSNAKRAMDCQIDLLLIAFGFYKVSQKKMWGFPLKLDHIGKLGIIAPRILKKVNKKRNLLEHQFVKPIKEEVEDMLDISLLFVASTEKYTLKFSPFVHLKNLKMNNQFFFNLDYKNMQIIAYEYPYEITVLLSELGKNTEKLISKVVWKRGEDDYVIMLKKYLTLVY